MDNSPLKKEYDFKSYKDGADFVFAVSEIAESIDHHPLITLDYKKVRVESISHDLGEVTDRDRDLMSKIDDYFVNNYQSNGADMPDQDNQYDYSTVTIYTDGGSRGNPGPSASGFVIYDANEKIIVRSANYIGVTTNNQAEYISVKNALTYAQKLSAKKVVVFMDSQLVINQLNGEYKVKNRDLWPIYQSVKELSKTFGHISFNHTPREGNKLADALVNESLDKATDILYNN